MTTIAYRDGVVATDTQSTCGHLVYDRAREKRLSVRGAVFWLCGDNHDAEAFANKILDGVRFEKNGYDCDGLALIEGALYSCGCSEGTYWKSPITSGPWAWGSGAEVAMGAMAMNATPGQAITVASALDVFTGGEVREYDARTGELLS